MNEFPNKALELMKEDKDIVLHISMLSKYCFITIEDLPNEFS